MTPPSQLFGTFPRIQVMVANDVFYSSAISNTILALALSFVVILMVTGNWIATVLAELTLISIVSSCFAMIATLGPNFDYSTREEVRCHAKVKI